MFVVCENGIHLDYFGERLERYYVSSFSDKDLEEAKSIMHNLNLDEKLLLPIWIEGIDGFLVNLSEYYENKNDKEAVKQIDKNSKYRITDPSEKKAFVIVKDMI